MDRNINWSRVFFILILIVSIPMNLYTVIFMGNLFTGAVLLLELTMLILLYHPNGSRFSLAVVAVGGIFTAVEAFFLILGGISILFSDLPEWASIVGTILMVPGLKWGRDTALSWYEERRSQM